MAMRVFVPRDATACALGADEVTDLIRDGAAGRGLDIEIIRNGSRGAFWLEPMVEVETDEGRWAFGPVGAADVPGLFEAGFPGEAQHPLALGRVEDIPWLSKQERLTFVRAGLGDPLSLEDYQGLRGYKGLQRALEMEPQAIVDEIKESGLRGRGGAAFPTGIKWQTVLDTQADQKFIVANADEGDSGTFADRLLMEADPYQLIEGMTIAGLAVGATEGYIYLRSEYPHCRKVLTEAISRAEQAGFLGTGICGSNRDFRIDLRIGAGAYICGEETSLLDSLEGKRGLIRFKPPLPAIKGLLSRFWNRPFPRHADDSAGRQYQARRAGGIAFRSHFARTGGGLRWRHGQWPSRPCHPGWWPPGHLSARGALGCGSGLRGPGGNWRHAGPWRHSGFR